MDQTELQSAANTDQLPARITDNGAVPWVPLGEGKAFKPLRFFSDNRGFVELLRLDPGVEIAWHRHTGEVHAINLQGARELYTGERVNAGDYVFEPPGNTDSWAAAGDTPLIVHIVVMGAVEYVGADGEVEARYDSNKMQQLYRDYCEEAGIDIVDLVD